jgi:hypothetical protein
MICQNTALRSFLPVYAIIRERAVPMRRKEKIWAIQRPGFTTRAAISIIMNTGSIFLSVRKRD